MANRYRGVLVGAAAGALAEGLAEGLADGLADADVVGDGFGDGCGDGLVTAGDGLGDWPPAVSPVGLSVPGALLPAEKVCVPP